MKTIINFVKSYSPEFMLSLITICIITWLYTLYGTFETDWIRVPAQVIMPFVITIVYFNVIPDDSDMYRDSIFFTWIACMLIAFGMQCYLAYPSWGILGYFILDAIVGFVGAFFTACAVCGADDPYD